MDELLIKELYEDAETLASRAANLKRACSEKNKNRIYWYANEVRFWANSVLGDFFEIINKEGKKNA